MERKNYEKIIEQWMPVMDSLDDINLEKISKKEKLCLYAHYYSENEKNNINSTLINLQPNVIDYNNTLLPIGLKILSKLSSLDNVIVVNSPNYKYENRYIQIGNLDITSNIEEYHGLSDLEKAETIENIIIADTVDVLNKEIKNNKIIFIYYVVSSIRLLSEYPNSSRKICWTLRISII